MEKGEISSVDYEKVLHQLNSSGILEAGLFLAFLGGDTSSSVSSVELRMKAVDHSAMLRSCRARVAAFRAANRPVAGMDSLSDEQLCSDEPELPGLDSTCSTDFLLVFDPEGAISLRLARQYTTRPIIKMTAGEFRKVTGGAVVIK
jgi:hypothetical protein